MHSLLAGTEGFAIAEIVVVPLVQDNARVRPSPKIGLRVKWYPWKLTSLSRH